MPHNSLYQADTLHSAFSTILFDADLRYAFVKVANAVKSKQIDSLTATLGFLNLMNCFENQHPQFTIEIYQYLTEPKSRNWVLSEIRKFK